MKKLLSMLAVLTAFSVALTSCKDDPEEPTIAVTAVNVTPSPASVVAGETLQLAVEVLPADATDKTVTWGSRSEAVATVNQSGLVTGVTVGEANIWAQAGTVTKQITVTVTAAPIRVESVTMNKTELPLFIGKTEKLTYTTNPDNPTYPTATWTSSSEAVATVAEDGTVTAVAEGTATITVTVDEKTAACAVTVSTPALESISTPYLKTLSSGATVQMTAEGFKAGDKVRLEALVGAYTSGDIDVTNVTATGAAFVLPAAAPIDRSLKLTVMRDGAAAAVDYIRYDDDMVQFSPSVVYALTAASYDMNTEGINEKVTRGGYLESTAVLLYNEDDLMYDASAADLALATFAPAEDGTLDLQYTTGQDDLSAFYGFPNLDQVKTLHIANAGFKTIDMTKFPNCQNLYGWGDAGAGGGDLTSVNFGTYGTDAVCKLADIRLATNKISGTLDMRNCLYARKVQLQDNQIESLNLNSAAGLSTDPYMMVIYDLNAKNNKLREIDISNCGRIRQLWLEGNKIERAKLQNNAIFKSDGMYSDRQGHTDPDANFPWMYIYKTPNCFSITWATEAEAEGRTRHIDAEYYWWRKFSGGNQGEIDGHNNDPNNANDQWAFFQGGWTENGPIVQALASGFSVSCWSYCDEYLWYPVSQGSNLIHTHQGGEAACSYFD